MDIQLPPFFVVGSERSGSTLFGHMLGRHPQLALARGGEFDRSVALMTDSGERPSIADLVEYAETDFEFFMTGELIDETQTYDDNVRRWLDEARVRAGAQFAGGIVHKHFSRLPFLFPHAKYIHLLRDGRDVAMSCIKKGWSHDLWHAADLWMQAESEWDRLEAVIAPGDAIEVRYEDLTRDPAAELERVCTFLGAEPRVDEMLSYAGSSAYEAPHTVMVEAWTRWPDHQVQLAEARMGDLLLERGYRLSGLPRLTPTKAKLLMIRSRSRAMGLAARVRERGAVTTTADLVGRRLQSPRLRKWAARRINQMTSDHLTHVSEGVVEAREAGADSEDRQNPA